MKEYHESGPFIGQIILSKLTKEEHLEHIEHLLKTKYAKPVEASHVNSGVIKHRGE